MSTKPSRRYIQRGAIGVGVALASLVALALVVSALPTGDPSLIGTYLLSQSDHCSTGQGTVNCWFTMGEANGIIASYIEVAIIGAVIGSAGTWVVCR